MAKCAGRCTPWALALWIGTIPCTIVERWHCRCPDTIKLSGRKEGKQQPSVQNQMRTEAACAESRNVATEKGKTRPGVQRGEQCSARPYLRSFVGASLPKHRSATDRYLEGRNACIAERDSCETSSEHVGEREGETRRARYRHQHLRFLQIKRLALLIDVMTVWNRGSGLGGRSGVGSGLLRARRYLRELGTG